MTMIDSLVKAIRGPWLIMAEFQVKTALLILFAMAGGASAAEPALTELGQGISAYNSRDFTGAISHLRAAHDITGLPDYVTYYLAYSEVLTGDVDSALSLLNVYRMNPVESSPITGRISLLYARALLDKRTPDSSMKALNVLQSDHGLLPQPDGDFAFGLAYEALGEQPQAALSYERAFYDYPNTDLAEQASSAMDRLRTALGKDFPVAPASLQLERCEKWLDAKQYLKARQEYTALAEKLDGAERDRARVGIGKSEYMGGEFNPAFRYLKELHVADAGADAERLYYLTESSRKVSDETEMMDAVKRLGEHYPQSPWRLRALIAAGNQYLATPESAQATPLFKAAADSFADDDSAAYAHWMVAWDAYLNDKTERTTLLREQVERYPGDSRAGTALYFLGRIAEANLKYGEARAYYDRLDAQFPHYFYAMMARQQIRDKVAEAEAETDAVMWLEDVDWPVHRDLSAVEPNTATKRRIERAHLLDCRRVDRPR